MQIRTRIFGLLGLSLIAFLPDIENSRPPKAGIVLLSAVTAHQTPVQAHPSSTDAVFQSVDGGQTWQDVSDGLPEYLEIACIFSDGKKVLLGTDIGLYQISTAQVAPVWEKLVLLDENVADIFPGRAGPYIRCAGNGFVHETLPGTGDWQSFSYFLKTE